MEPVIDTSTTTIAYGLFKSNLSGSDVLTLSDHSIVFSHVVHFDRELNVYSAY